MPSNPRQVCLRALLEWEKGKSFSDEILHTMLEKEPLSPVDRGFLMETFFGILRNLSRLDFLVAQLREESLDAQTRAVVRLGMYQIFHMRTPPHAAVNETVALGGRARGLVNAVLRRALREKEVLERRLAEATQAIRTSHPDFLINRWEEHYGTEATQRLCAWNNEPAEVYVRANGLKVTAGELLRTASDAEPSEFHPKSLRVKRLPYSWIVGGLCYVQDPSTLLACDLLAPQPGETVLDACAAPGGKTTYIAELMQNEGRIVACDIYESRVARLRENLTRLGVTNADVLQHDAMLAPEEDTPNLQPGTFDRVLVDAPCSNTGVLRRRVDVRWRLTDEDFIRMPAHQLALVRRSSQMLKPKGVLVYSTCSLEKEENDQLVEQIIANVPELQHVESQRSLPFVDKVDGAFAAKFVKR